MAQWSPGSSRCRTCRTDTRCVGCTSALRRTAKSTRTFRCQPSRLHHRTGCMPGFQCWRATDLSARLLDDWWRCSRSCSLPPLPSVARQPSAEPRQWRRQRAPHHALRSWIAPPASSSLPSPRLGRRRQRRQFQSGSSELFRRHGSSIRSRCGPLSGDGLCSTHSLTDKELSPNFLKPWNVGGISSWKEVQTRRRIRGRHLQREPLLPDIVSTVACHRRELICARHQRDKTCLAIIVGREPEGRPVAVAQVPRRRGHNPRQSLRAVGEEARKGIARGLTR